MNFAAWPVRARGCRGAVLLEVVLALVLFVAAATFVSGGLSAAVDALDRLRVQAHAADLTISVLSELQMGVRPLESAGPEPFEVPFEAWTWEVVVVALDSTAEGSLQQVEIIVRQPEEEITRRLRAWLPFRSESEEDSGAFSEDELEGGLEDLWSIE